jgi:fatty-acyl-CoA synthase
VPATMQAVIEHPRWPSANLASLRAVSTGSTQVPQRLVDAFVERGIPVLQVYGSTETCPIAVYTRLSGDWRRPRSTGLPGLLCQARVVDDSGSEVASGTAGEVVVKGANTLIEYWGDPEASAQALREGWYQTGDIATRDADGHFYVHERKRNVIISGGENIYPAEVERVLHEHTAVAAAAVIGRADEKWQEVPIACLVRRAHVTADAVEIEAFCLAQLARYKVPREYIWLDDLPRNAMGKVQHFRLKEMLAEGRLAAPARDAKTDPATSEGRAGGRWKWLIGRG